VVCHAIGVVAERPDRAVVVGVAEPGADHVDYIVGLGTKVTLNGAAPVPTYDITGGTRPGNGTNLFHSFGDFSVGTHDIARFGNDSGLLTTNILSRVTGGQPSNIFGTVQTAGFGTAALWLINPAGIVFGPTASLNVGGSVHFSTADYLRLGSGNDRFYADLGKTSQLTSAPVTAFGFLGERPAGPITVQAGNPLAVSEGKAISLIGGDISITGGLFPPQADR
jgi:filamentous hemagglutinin family protein